MGGYGALNIGLHHLSTFGTIESWSGYFHEDTSGAFSGATPANLRYNSPAAYAPSMRRGRSDSLPVHVFLYSGAAGPADPQPGAVRAGAEASWGSRSAPRSPRELHDWRLWRAQMPTALSYAGHWLYASASAAAHAAHRARTGSADSASRVWAGASVQAAMPTPMNAARWRSWIPGAVPSESPKATKPGHRRRRRSHPPPSRRSRSSGRLVCRARWKQKNAVTPATSRRTETAS